MELAQGLVDDAADLALEPFRLESEERDVLLVLDVAHLELLGLQRLQEDVDVFAGLVREDLCVQVHLALNHLEPVLELALLEAV